eukprot:9398535-Alexandrium_andersonii.AAC.1
MPRTACAEAETERRPDPAARNGIDHDPWCAGDSRHRRHRRLDSPGHSKLICHVTAWPSLV